MAYQLKDADGSIITLRGKEVMACDFTTEAVKSVDMDKRLLRIIATDESVDRDGDIISTKGWDFENYKKNPVFLWGHDYSSVPLAAATKIERKREPWRIVLTHKFPTEGLNPFADMILNLYNEKVINAGSVGFFPFQMEKMDLEEIQELGSKLPWAGMRFTEQELLEHSGVSVPANPNAVQDAAKSLSIKTLWKGNGMVEIDLPHQTRHDILCEIEAIQSKGVEVEDITTTTTQVQVPDDLSETKVSDQAVDDGTDGSEEEETVVTAQAEITEGRFYSFDSDEVFLYVKGEFIKEEFEEEELAQVKNLTEFFDKLTDEWFAEGLEDQVVAYREKFNQLAKAGAVLNKKNKARLKQVLELITEVLQDADALDDGDGQTNDDSSDGKVPTAQPSAAASILDDSDIPEENRAEVKRQRRKQIKKERVKALDGKLAGVVKVLEKIR